MDHEHVQSGRAALPPLPELGDHLHNNQRDGRWRSHIKNDLRWSGPESHTGSGEDQGESIELRRHRRELYAVVETFHSTLTVTPVIVAPGGMRESEPNVPRSSVRVWFLLGAVVAYTLSEL